MKKILLISHYLSVAGTETFMMNVYRNLNPNEFKTEFLIFTKNISEYSEEIERNGGVIYRLPDGKSGFKYYKALKDFFKNRAKEYSAIHFCGGNLSSIAPLFYAYKYKVPVRIVHSHNSSSKGSVNIILHKINRTFIPKLCTDYFACSSKAGKYFFKNKPFVVINNCVDLGRFTFDVQKRNFIRTKLGIQSNAIVIGHIGRFDSVKNHHRIIDIFEEFQKKNNNSVLLLVGEGDLMQEIKIKVKTKDLSRNVLFLGVRSDIPDLLSAMDCFLMPSLFEGLPFVLVEGQATGLPCVVSNNMNKEVKIIPPFDFCDLSDSNAIWVNKMENLLENNDRTDVHHYFNDRGFSMKDMIVYLEKIYNG